MATQHFVEFNKGGTWKLAVVVERSMRGGPWRLATEDGKSWRVPQRLIRETTRKFAAADAADVVEGSRALREHNEKIREERRPLRQTAKDAAAARLAPAFARLQKGAIVQYLGAYGHPQVMLVELHPEEGKVTISNPNADLAAFGALFGVSIKRRTPATVKVWVNRVRAL